jgi:hypothetical protein
MQTIERFKTKVKQTLQITQQFLSLSFSKHQHEPLLLATYNTVSDIINVGLETIQSFIQPNRNTLIARQAGVSYYVYPITLKNKEYIYICPYKATISKVKQIFEGIYDESNHWVRTKDVTLLILKYAGPCENFFNNSITPEIIGLNDIEIIKIDTDEMQNHSVFIKKTEPILL